MFTRDGMIEWVGDEIELPAGLRPERTVELAGRWLTPGLIDCHTHLVFAGQRAAEFARRTSGTSYAEIAREGGGILGTMRATRAVTEEALFEQSRPRLESLLQEGVTTVEIKSGYGLELETEKKMLRVARRLGAGHPVTVSTSFLAAHALPPEFSGRPDEYIDTICNEWLPDVAGGLADSVDAFCEDIGFSAAQCDRLFAAARELGLPVRLHAEQLSNVGGSQVAARHGALSCDHLEYANEQDAVALAAQRHGRRDAARRVLHACRERSCRRSRRCGRTACRWPSRPTAIPAPRRAPRCCSRSTWPAACSD